MIPTGLLRAATKERWINQAMTAAVQEPPPEEVA
jgi:hypothetical protein